MEQAEVWKSLFDFIKAQRPARIVIDSVTHLRYLSADPYQFRKHVRGLVSCLHQSGCTAYLLYEPAEHAGILRSSGFDAAISRVYDVAR